MRKQYFFLLFILTIPLFGQQEEVSISLEAPEEAVAGENFELTLKFNKGNLKDYSRFSQDLPSGVSAENVNSPNADFTFTDQRIRIIWLRLPAEQEVVVNYMIKVDKRLSGKLVLNGTFAYVENGERKYLKLASPTVVNILPNPNIDPNLIVDIKDFSKLKTPVNIVDTTINKPSIADFAIIVREKPVIGQNGIVYVSLLINNPEGSSFLKLEELIPAGYSFESIDANNAVVSQSSGLVRFIWMKPPNNSVFLIKYRLIPLADKSQGPLSMQGTLSFTENGETKIANIREVDVNFEGMTPSQQKSYLKTGIVPDNLAQKKIPINSIDDRVYKQKQARQNEIPLSAVNEKHYTKSNMSSVIDIPMLEKGEGNYFRVQIAALRYPNFPEVVFAGYDLLRDVRLEVIGGWSKYTIGSFSTYEEAKLLKERINSETPLESSFIVAYQNGVRVPIKDVY